MAFYNTTLSQSLDDRYYKYSEIREIYRNQTNQIQSVGLNFSGTVGDNSTVDKSFATASTLGNNWTKISSGWWTGVVGGIDYSGALWTWGNNEYGQLGQNNRVHRSSPIQVGTSKWVALSCSSRGAFAIRTDGGLFAWGRGDLGLNGQGDIVDRSSPVQIGTSSWSMVSDSGIIAIAIRSDGALFTWGFNGNGGLGINDNSIAGRSSPVQIGTGNSWIFATAGFYRAFAVRGDYTLWGWGLNDGYEIGDGTNVHRSSPVQITAADGTVSFTQVSSNGLGHTLALSTSGKVYAWGGNTWGECGLGVANTYVTQPSPVVGAGTYTQVQAGSSGSTILRTDGTAFWFGQAPLYSTDGSKSSPVQISAFRYRALSHSVNLLLLKE